MYAACHAISHHAADQREQKDGNAAEKLIEREQERGVAEPVNQPALRDDLHPGADAGGAGANPHQAEIAILKCFKNAANQADRLRRLRKSLTRAYPDLTECRRFASMFSMGSRKLLLSRGMVRKSLTP